MIGTLASGEPIIWRELLDLNPIGPLTTVRHAIRNKVEGDAALGVFEAHLPSSGGDIGRLGNRPHFG